ncbi:MAG: protein-methionine-sulfoxide reductase catalytic subunit MsrP, partial [Methyloceanibacter sp.]
MLIRPLSDIRPSEITPKDVYFNRRQFLALAAGVTLGAAAPRRVRADVLSFVKGPFSTDETPTSREDITNYNNFYEFGVDKTDPAANAHQLTTKPWSVKIDGLVARPADYILEDLVKPMALEERIYRLRCVEGWSMVIPWVGFPLANVLKRVEPLGSAKFVAFETLVRPREMPGQSSLIPILDWP